MSELREHVSEYIQLLEAGDSIAAMQRFYADDVVLFENREMARAGRENCMAFEREQLSKQSSPPRLRAKHSAVDETTGRAYVEWVIRFVTPEGRDMLLEEIAAQQWSRGQITEERFYYEGFVDESD
ncbi:MAG: nuclear transport factor 2 family protein [Polyangiaceae bacterium]|nr:nuclear transport factor 2 family protein [Polyangiaceae bacterium]